MQDKIKIFISSVQREFITERRAIKDYILSDPLLKKYFTVFLFEDLPASDQLTNEAYLEELDRAGIYIGIFGNEYGYEDPDGISPTEHEFNKATTDGIVRLIFLTDTDNSRHPKMNALVRKASSQLIRRRFAGTTDLLAQIYAALIKFLEDSGHLPFIPFDAAACHGANLDDISPEKLTAFLEKAKSSRSYSLDVTTPVLPALAHMNMLYKEEPSNSAILLFGKQPQKFLLSSEVKCLHFYSDTVQRPMPSYQIYKGTLFELVDQAVDFVMSKIDRYVGTRSDGPQAPVIYEIPPDAIFEAVVNAIAHRDYTSNASVQVMLFSDRLEIWNPGHLPPELTIDQLYVAHTSIPHNLLVANALFLVRYIEKAGTGILTMIKKCLEAGLPLPEFRQVEGQFVQILWRKKAMKKPEAVDSTGAGSGAESGAGSMAGKSRFGSCHSQL